MHKGLRWGIQKKIEENVHVFEGIIMRPVEPLLVNDSKRSNYGMAVTRQQPLNSNRRTVLSVRPMPRCYTQDRFL
jgi:hypothetical protein